MIVVCVTLKLAKLYFSHNKNTNFAYFKYCLTIHLRNNALSINLIIYYYLQNMRNTDYVKSSEPIEKTISKDVIVSRSGRKVKPTLKYLDTIDTEVLKRPKQSKKVTNKRRKVSKMSTSTKSIEISKCGKISSEGKIEVIFYAFVLLKINNLSKCCGRGLY